MESIKTESGVENFTVNDFISRSVTGPHGDKLWTTVTKSPFEDLTPHSPLKPLIPKSMMVYIDIYAHIVVPFIVSSFGVVSNVINLIIFTSLGLRDSMSVGLWCLSCSDLTVTAQTLGSSVCSLCGLLLPSDTRISPGLVHYVSLLWSQDMMYLVSNWITTFISLERCVCVIMPFKVKAIFTRSRSVAVIVCIFLAHVISYAPIFASHRLDFETISTENNDGPQFSILSETEVDVSSFPFSTPRPPSTSDTAIISQTNVSEFVAEDWETMTSADSSLIVTKPFGHQSSQSEMARSLAALVTGLNQSLSAHLTTTPESSAERVKSRAGSENTREVMVVRFSKNRAAIHHTVDIINGAVLPVVQQALVIASAGGLAFGLKSASRVRSKAHGQNYATGAENPDGGSKDTENTSRQTQKSALSQKEIRLVKVVGVLALILTICNVPRFIAVYTTLLIPEMHIGEAYENMYVFLWALTALFASVNASVNIFVYLRVNAAYRAAFKSLFACCIPHKEI